MAEGDPFADCVEHLRRGDFSLLEPLFADHTDPVPCPVVRWLAEGRFREAPDALREAFTCACFLGKTTVVRAFLAAGTDAKGGDATGLNAVHWAVNRGQLETVQLLLETGASLETRNSYGGTVLAAAVWAAIHEPRSTHAAIIEALLDAGAQVQAVDYPTGVGWIDGILRRHFER